MAWNQVARLRVGEKQKAGLHPDTGREDSERLKLDFAERRESTTL
jgi:hypothetical protein